MPTTSRRSWLSTFLLALVAMVLPRAKAAAGTQTEVAYEYDAPHMAEVGESWDTPTTTSAV